VKLSGALFARHILVSPDTMSPEEFRQIRVMLRWLRRSARDKTTTLGPP
jgi:hypothetical protein